MTTPQPFITKLIVPKRKGEVLRRQRLLDFLHEYLDRKLLLLSASAGYGKTTLLVDFAHDTDFPICWYTLDGGDRDPQVFFEYLVASLQRQFPNFGGRTGALLRDHGAARDFDAVVGTLVTEIHQDIAPYFVIVLDDYHLVDDSEPVNRLLDHLLKYLPDNAHIILASRTLPTQLTLTGLASRLQVAGLGVNDLKFDADEIQALMRQNYRLEITKAVALRLAEQSEGWIAGIVLTTPTLWQGLFEDWVKARGPGSQLFDYLATEVFAQQPEPLQRFLLATSVLEPLNAILCNELLGTSDARAQLQALEARNVFITRAEGEEWYRYHHLFREHLQARLKRDNPARFRELHQRAAESFERLGYQNEAVEHWIQGEAFERAVRLIEDSADALFDQGRWTTLARWIDALPVSVTEANPTLLLRRGKVYAETGDLSRAQTTLERAQLEFEKRGESRNVARALIEQAVIARFQGQARACIEKCGTALARLDADDFPLNALAHRVIATARVAQGDFGGSIPQFERALSLYRLANDPYDSALTEQDLGLACRAIGNGPEANAHFQNVLAHWRQFGNAADLANTLNSIGVGHYYQGDLEQARAVLEEARGEASKVGSLRIEAYALAGLGDVYRDGGEVERALQTYAEAYEIAGKVNESFLVTFVLGAMATTYRFKQDLGTAEKLARSAVDTARSHQSDYESGLAQTALGSVRLEQGAFEEAAVCLNHALGLFERGQARRDSARVHYFLARTLFEQGRMEDAHRELEDLAALGQALDEDMFILSEGPRLVPLLQFALTGEKGNDYFRRVLEKSSRRGDTLPAAAPVQVVESSWPRLQIFSLGAARVVRGGEEVAKSAWQTATTKELFFYFAVHPQAWRKEQIVAELWQDTQAAKANDIFHSSVYRIRRALFPECLLYHNGLYELNPETERWTDADEFERLLEAAHHAPGPAQAVELLNQALVLYRGDFLQEFYSDWCQTRRESLREKYVSGLTLLAHHHEHLKEREKAVELYRSALKEDGLREETYRALMTLYWEMGDRAAAVQTYRRCAQALGDELGVTPMPETLALYERILHSPLP
jgi:ATP/maltotriose-dependent transcriptional regulator MalT